MFGQGPGSNLRLREDPLCPTLFRRLFFQGGILSARFFVREDNSCRQTNTATLQFPRTQNERAAGVAKLEPRRTLNGLHF